MRDTVSLTTLSRRVRPSLPRRVRCAALLTKELTRTKVRTLNAMGVRTGLITNTDARIGVMLRRAARLCAQSSCSGCPQGPWDIGIPLTRTYK